MSATIPLPVPAALRLHQLFARAWAAWRQLRARHATRRALLSLDDRTLRDIGFVRAEIDSVAAEVHGGVAVTRARLLGHTGALAH